MYTNLESTVFDIIRECVVYHIYMLYYLIYSCTIVLSIIYCSAPLYYMPLLSN